MATVDPDDDSIVRWVVRHYGYDPRRNQRRHQVVAAFDNEREFRKLFDRLAADLQRRRSTDRGIDPAEHYSGGMLEPGYRRRQQDGRLVGRAIRHGVALSDEFLARLDLPPNIGVIRGESL